MKKNITIILILLLTIVSSSIAFSLPKRDNRQSKKRVKIENVMRLMQSGQFKVFVYNSFEDNYKSPYRVDNGYECDLSDPEYKFISDSMDKNKEEYVFTYLRPNNTAATSIILNLRTGSVRVEGGNVVFSFYRGTYQDIGPWPE